MDPREYKTPSDLEYHYKTAWALAKAAEEILSWVEEAEETAKFLTKKQKGENKKKYAIGKGAKN